MKTPREKRSIPYFNRRDQYRMLAMVGLLSLVLVAIKFAAQPSSWYWLLPPEGAQSVPDGSQTLKELDFRVQDTGANRLKPDEFRVVAAANETPIDSESGNAPTDSASVDIPPELLNGIEDNTLGVRRAEAEAYHTMLDRIRSLPDDVIAANASGDVAFTVIMLQPEGYRGQLVRITGHLRRLTPFPTQANDHGIDRLYEGWVFTNDSGNNPWRILVTELPDEAPQGKSFDPIKVQVTGYFFKRYGYPSEEGQHVAPTLLAKSFSMVPTPADVTPQVQADMDRWLLGVIGVIAVGIVGLFWWFRSSDRAFARSRMSELAAARLDASPADLAALRNVETRDPSTMFVDGVTTGEPSDLDDRP